MLATCSNSLTRSSLSCTKRTKASQFRSVCRSSFNRERFTAGFVKDSSLDLSRGAPRQEDEAARSDRAKSAIHPHSSSLPRFFPFSLRSIPRGTDRPDRNHSPLPSAVVPRGAINFSSPPFPLLLPGGRGSTERDSRPRVCTPETDVGARRSSIWLSPMSYKFNSAQ